MSVAELFNKALLHLRPSGTGWLGDFLSLWIEPKHHVHAWFAGENNNMRVWDFQVADEDIEKFLVAVPDAEKRDMQVHYGAI